MGEILVSTYLAIRTTGRSTRHSKLGHGRRAAASMIESSGTTEAGRRSDLESVGVYDASEVGYGSDGIDATYQHLDYADTFIIQGDDSTALERAREVLEGDYVLVPNIALSMPGSVPSGASLSAAEAHAIRRKLDRMTGVTAAHDAGERGGGAMVIILDTGFDADHAEFVERTIDFVYAPLDNNVDLRTVRGFDTVNHGTHVAGIIGGATMGLAPEATLFPAGVIESERTISSLQRLAKALNWSLAQISKPEVQHKPAILNLSLGFLPEQIEPTAIRAAMVGVRLLLNQLVNDFDVLPVVSIGNDGAGVVRAPGYFPETLAVGCRRRRARSRRLQRWRTGACTVRGRCGTESGRPRGWGHLVD